MQATPVVAPCQPWVAVHAAPWLALARACECLGSSGESRPLCLDAIARVIAIQKVIISQMTLCCRIFDTAELLHLQGQLEDPTRQVVKPAIVDPAIVV